MASNYWKLHNHRKLKHQIFHLFVTGEFSLVNYKKLEISLYLSERKFCEALKINNLGAISKNDNLKIFLLDLKLDTWAGKNIHIKRIKTLS